MNPLLIKLGLLFCLSGLCTFSFAQTQSVRGIVTDEKGLPLSGVSVYVKGSTNATQTNSNGQFSLNAPLNAILVFTSVGFETVEAQVVGGNTMNITLSASASDLTSVVVIGYGTARKRDLTGSSVSIKGSDIINIPALTATQAIQGKAAGVQIINSGAPGSTPNVRIRGTGSILGGVDPLYVVDGIITTDIRNINTADILSVDVLKDASSTAIYGARAANGVILITTKAGTRGGLTINYNGYGGVKLLTHKVEMAPPNLFTLYSNEAAGVNAILSADITGATDWYEELTRPAFMQNHAVSIGGSKNQYRYFFSTGYLNEQGILLGNNYRRFTFRYNHDMNIGSKFKIGNNLSYSDYASENKPYSLFTTAYIAAPIYNAKNPDGTYGFTTKSDVGNPLAALEYTNDRSWGRRAQATLWGEYQLLRNLSFRSSFGIDAEQNNGRNYSPVFQVGNTTQRNEVSRLNYSKDSIYQWVWDNILTFEKQLGANHHLRLMGGHTAERRNGWGSRASRSNVENNKEAWVLNFKDTIGGQENFRDPIGNYFRRESYFIRANYRLMEKYLVNATFRRDASSNFSLNNRWASFPSVGVGWLITKENFMASQKTFDLLKLRASYGLAGNDVIRPGAFDLRPNEFYFSYFGTDRINGTTVVGIVDPNLKWEVVKELDLGIEFALLEGKLNGEIDYYYKKATDALYTIPLVQVGFGDNFLTNAADIVNKGIEISLGWNNTTAKGIKYTLRGNVTFNQNNVENIAAGKALPFGSLGNGWTATQTTVRQPIGSFWVFKTDGIFQTQAEVDAYPHITTAAPGDFKILDLNGDGEINNLDRYYAGSYQPKFYYGFNAVLNIKQLDFSLDIFGNAGNKVYNAKKGVRYGGNYNIEYDVAINRWQPGSNNNTTPRAYNGVPYPTDYFIESGSFVRVNNITVGYTLANMKLFNNVRIFASAQNPFIYTKYTGFTPELPGNQNEAGIELNVYPISATYMLGLNIQFK
ncbi:MAG: TonB-dependent receptor [Flavisolibacter sp.]|jgi:TonB-linked SusC/RagA family outer membrane protein|nr:TonB-dependent receptor [Flavisolibacter sp.]